MLIQTYCVYYDWLVRLGHLFIFCSIDKVMLGWNKYYSFIIQTYDVFFNLSIRFFNIFNCHIIVYYCTFLTTG